MTLLFEGIYVGLSGEKKLSIGNYGAGDKDLNQFRKGNRRTLLMCIYVSRAALCISVI